MALKLRAALGRLEPIGAAVTRAYKGLDDFERVFYPAVGIAALGLGLIWLPLALCALGSTVALVAFVLKLRSH